MLIVMEGRKDLQNLLVRQLESLFPVVEEDAAAIDTSLDEALRRIDYCFSHVRNKYYSDAIGTTKFNPLHGCQWATFLYFLSNTIWHKEGGAICDKIYALSRALSGADLFYQVELPDVFMFDHPLGSIIGRGSYSDFFAFSQGCTVGNNHGVYPSFGNSVFMMSDSKVIGQCHIGNYVIIAANAYVKDTDIPDGSIVFGQSPNLVIKEGHLDMVKGYAEEMFNYD